MWPDAAANAAVMMIAHFVMMASASQKTEN
jgi:hypothetical protein